MGMEDFPGKIWSEIDVKVMRHGRRSWHAIKMMCPPFPSRLLFVYCVKRQKRKVPKESNNFFNKSCRTSLYLVWLSVWKLSNKSPDNPWAGLRPQTSHLVLLSCAIQSWARSSCNGPRSRLEHREVALWHVVREQVLESSCHSGNE